MKRNRWLWKAVAMAFVFSSGCASRPTTSPAPGGIVYRQARNFPKVWLAKGFNFTGYDTIYITDTGATVAPLRHESSAFDAAKRLVRDEFAAAIQEKRLFENVVTREADIKPAMKVLKLQTKITEFHLQEGEPPIIGVHGIALDGNEPMFQFQSRRRGKATSLFSDEIRTMAKSLAEFIRREAKRPRA
jgi:hypothetical protein